MRGHVYEAVEWEHGLRCAECEHLFEEGERFEDVLHSMFDDGVPVMLIVCVACAASVAA